MMTSPEKNVILNVKKQLKNYIISDIIIDYLLSQIKYIYEYKKINEYIKLNRINFFAIIKK